MAQPCCSTAGISPDCGAPFVGAAAVVVLRVVNDACQAADATVAARLSLPGGAVVAPAVEHDALGTYHLEWPVAEAGQHKWRLEITVAAEPVDVVEGAFLAAPSKVLAS